MGTTEQEHNQHQAALLSGDANVLNPPSAVVKVAELGAAWAEAVARRVCLTLAVGDWPAWPAFDQAKRAARQYAATLAWGLHVHRVVVNHDPRASTSAALERQAAAEDALVRLCYEAARTRYLELAAWR
jgi:hypothetical protein